MIKWLSLLLHGKKDQFSGCRTIVYSLNGMPTTVHDSLPDLNLMNNTTREEIEFGLFDCFRNSDDFMGDDLELVGSQWLSMNPATGWPMLSYGLDIHGNLYGAGDCSCEINSDAGF